MVCCLTHQAIPSSEVLSGIHIKEIALMNWIHKMCSEIKLLKLLPYFVGAYKLILNPSVRCIQNRHRHKNIFRISENIFYLPASVYDSNLALHKPVYHRENPESAERTAEKAVDGDPWGLLGKYRDCSRHYTHNYKALLRIDLEQSYPISHIDIFPATNGKIVKIDVTYYKYPGAVSFLHTSIRYMLPPNVVVRTYHIMNLTKRD